MRLAAICLLSDDVPALARFYDRILGTATSPDPIHMVIESEGAGLILYDRTAALRDMGLAPAGGGVVLQFLVDDADRAYERMLALGIGPPSPPVTYPWGSRSFRIKDPEGNIANFAQPPAR